MCAVIRLLLFISLLGSRVTVIVLVGVAIAWIPIILTSAGGQLFIYLQSIQAALGPPIFALYIFAVLFPRVNETVYSKEFYYFFQAAEKFLGNPLEIRKFLHNLLRLP